MTQRMVFWLILMVLLLILEGITVQLTSIWFAIGAFAAAVASLLGAGLVPELLIFIGVSIVLLLFTRPYAIKHARRDTKTNVNSLPGTRAVVTGRIDNLAQTGEVRINDVDWLARSEKDEVTISEGAVVEILSVQGVRLIVKEVKKGGE